MLSDVAFSEGWLGAITYIDGILRTYIATESLSFTEAQFGTRAQSQTHRDVGKNDTGRVDAKWLESIINDQLITVALEANFGAIDLDDMPKWRSRLTNQIDAQGLQFMFDAGAPIDGDALASEWNIPIAGDNTELVMQKSQGPTPAQLTQALTAAPPRDPTLDPNGPDNSGGGATDSQSTGPN
jgi:phage gp29-like protein